MNAKIDSTTIQKMTDSEIKVKLPTEITVKNTNINGEVFTIVEYVSPETVIDAATGKNRPRCVFSCTNRVSAVALDTVYQNLGSLQYDYSTKKLPWQ